MGEGDRLVYSTDDPDIGKKTGPGRGKPASVPRSSAPRSTAPRSGGTDGSRSAARPGDRRHSGAPPRAVPGQDALPPGMRPDTVYVERTRKGRAGKTVTLVWNVPGDDAARLALLKTLKTSCGAGGTLRDGAIEVQGDHRDKLVVLLQGKGFTVKLRGG